MSTVEQLQVVVSEVQNARHQVATVRAQLQELETTITAVEKHPEGLALHRQLGGVLVEVEIDWRTESDPYNTLRAR